jgi:hypothetical protein
MGLFQLPASEESPRGTDDAKMVAEASQLFAEKVTTHEARQAADRAVRARYAVGDRHRAQGITSVVFYGGAGAALALVACATLGPVGGAAVALGAVIRDSMRGPRS